MDKMDTKELAELLLAAMYEETEALGHSNYFLALDEIAANLGIEDRQGVLDAAQFLEERGFIFLAFDHTSSLSAFILPPGEEFATQGGETGIIGEYMRFRSQTVQASAITGNAPPEISQITFESNPLPGSDKPLQNESAAHIIASLEMLVRNDPLISDTEKNDLIADIRTLEIQLSRNVINQPLIDNIVSGLKNIPSLSPLLDILPKIK